MNTRQTCKLSFMIWGYNMKKILLLLPLIGLLAGCVDEKKPSSDKVQAQQQEQLAKEAAVAVPTPAIVNFTEKRLLKELYELRDQPNYRTYTYITTLDGGLVKICDSVGFGLNASVQYSSPQKLVRADGGQYDIEVPVPQAEPNALFMPEGLSATYVMCLDPTSKDVKPVYLEPNIIVSPFPLVP
jgi:hypothetical protein